MSHIIAGFPQLFGSHFSLKFKSSLQTNKIGCSPFTTS